MKYTTAKKWWRKRQRQQHTVVGTSDISPAPVEPDPVLPVAEDDDLVQLVRLGNKAAC